MVVAWGRGGTGAGAAFARAGRHSRRVRQLRFAVPLLAIGLVGAFAVWPLLRLAAIPITMVSIKPVDLSEAAVTMETAKLTGFNSDSRPYEVIADRARQSLQDPLQIALAGLSARIGMDEGRSATIAAPDGIFRSGDQLLDLDSGVRVETSSGDNAQLQTARIELKGGRIATDRPLTIRMGSATLAADRMELSESGRTVVFEGSVVMVLQPKSEVADASGAASGTTGP